MLTYIYVYCITSSYSQSGDLQFYVDQDGVTHSKRMYVYSYSGDYTINSENMWFPMPTNRVLYMNVPYTFSNCYAYIYANGYR